MNAKRSRISRFFALERAQRAVLLEAAWTLIGAQIAVRVLPFRLIASRLGSPLETSPRQTVTAEQARQSVQVGWAIRKLAISFPWDVKCLGQAVAGKWMLQRRGLASTLYLGVDRGGESWLEAHAWLRCGEEILTGGPEHERFKVIAAFTEDWH